MKNWDKAAAMKLWEEGKVDPEIAAAVGVSPLTIRKWRKEEGLASNYRAEQKPSGAPPEERTSAAPPPAPVAEETEKTPPPAPEQDGPVELHLEINGGWARLRAPGWKQAAELWRMLDVCVGALAGR